MPARGGRCGKPGVGRGEWWSSRRGAGLPAGSGGQWGSLGGLSWVWESDLWERGVAAWRHEVGVPVLGTRGQAGAEGPAPGGSVLGRARGRACGQGLCGTDGFGRGEGAAARRGGVFRPAGSSAGSARWGERGGGRGRCERSGFSPRRVCVAGTAEEGPGVVGEAAEEGSGAGCECLTAEERGVAAAGRAPHISGERASRSAGRRALAEGTCPGRGGGKRAVGPERRRGGGRGRGHSSGLLGGGGGGEGSPAPALRWNRSAERGPSAPAGSALGPAARCGERRLGGVNRGGAAGGLLLSVYLHTSRQPAPGAPGFFSAGASSAGSWGPPPRAGQKGQWRRWTRAVSDSTHTGRAAAEETTESVGVPAETERPRCCAVGSVLEEEISSVLVIGKTTWERLGLGCQWDYVGSVVPVPWYWDKYTALISSHLSKNLPVYGLALVCVKIFSVMLENVLTRKIVYEC